MINFRFHLVSLTAVFLALAVGIGVGAAVVDQATVDLLRRQLDQVETRRDRTNSENAALRTELARWDDFSRQAGDQVVSGRLQDVPLLLVAVEGVDRGSMASLRESVVAAGATYEGTVWLTSKWRLVQPDHARELGGIVGGLVGEERPDVVRRAALGRLAESWAGGDRAPLLAALAAAAFATFEAPAASPAPLSSLPLQGTRYVIVSGEGAAVPSESLAVPLTELLALEGGIPIVAAEPGAAAPKPEDRPPFVGPLRANSDVAARLSTVDNVDDYRGRVAVVLALDVLGQGRTGHFGVRPGAQRLVPEPAP